MIHHIGYYYSLTDIKIDTVYKETKHPEQREIYQNKIRLIGITSRL